MKTIIKNSDGTETVHKGASMEFRLGELMLSCVCASKGSYRIVYDQINVCGIFGANLYNAIENFIHRLEQKFGANVTGFDEAIAFIKEGHKRVMNEYNQNNGTKIDKLNKRFS